MVRYFVTLNKINEIRNELNNLAGKESEISKKIQENTKNIGELEEKLKNLKIENHDLISTLTNVQEMLKKNSNIVLNSELIEVITVDEERYHLLSNGLVELNRDILMKLIRLIYYSEEVRSIIGMMDIFYKWSKLSIFRWARKHAYFLPKNPPKSVVYSENKCIFQNKYCSFTISLAYKLVVGQIYALNLLSKNYTKAGLALKTLFPELHSRSWVGTAGTCAVYSDRIYVGGRLYCLALMWSANSPSTFITLELDTNVGVLHLFVDGKQLPHTITDIPVSKGVCFVLGSSGFGLTDISLEVISLHTVGKTQTNQLIKCQNYVWM